MKIRPQEEIDNFAFKNSNIFALSLGQFLYVKIYEFNFGSRQNSNIIIEGLIWKRKDYFS